MGINFPAAPTNGQLYPQPPVAGVPVYIWDGEKWTTQGTGSSGGSGGGATVYVSDTAPAGTPDNSLFWESDTGILYVNYNDGDSKQFVSVVSANDPTTYSVRYDMAQTLTAPQKAQARSNIDALNALKRNYIINGAMMVSQENGTTAVTGNGNPYAVDQFAGFWGTGSNVNMQQMASTTPGGSPNRLRCTVVNASTLGAGNSQQIFHQIEGLRVTDLFCGLPTAKTITIQFGVRAPAGTYCINARNAAANRSYVAEYTIAAGEANIDVVKSVIIPMDQTGTWATDNTIGLGLRWVLAAGTSFQQAAGSWQATSNIATPNQFNFVGTAGNVFELFDVGLYEGVVPAFQVPDYVSELALCKRYLRRTASGVGIAFNTTGARFEIDHSGMRALPTVSATGPMAITDIYAGNYTQSAASATAFNATQDSGQYDFVNFTGLTTGRAQFILPGSPVLQLSARL